MDLISKDKNIKFSKLNKIELKEYLHELENFYLHYDKMLDIDKKYTFGCEIEYRKIDKDMVDNFIKTKLPYWQSIKEVNIQYGGEIISPILNNDEDAWNELDMALTYLKDLKAFYNDTGAHIHIGVDTLGKNITAWKNFIYLYIVFENVLYRFYNGEYLNGREKQNAVAYPCAIELANKLKETNIEDIDSLKEFLYQDDRFQGINFKNINYDLIDECIYKNTIELRMPNGTLKKEIWQNNINFILHFLDKAINETFDYEFLLHKIKKVAELDNYISYYRINIHEALYLADLIFDNNYEKAKFLCQYYKDGEEEANDILTISRKKLVKN